MEEAIRAMAVQIGDLREEAFGWLLTMPSGWRLCWHDQQAVMGVQGPESFRDGRDSARLAWRIEYHFLGPGSQCSAPGPKEQIEARDGLRLPHGG